VSPFFGRKDPERMSADDVKALVEDTEIDGPLVDWKEKEARSRTSERKTLMARRRTS